MCIGILSADKKTCTACLAGSNIVGTSLGVVCKACPGSIEYQTRCKACSKYNETFNQATKKCVTCSVPGIVTVNTSGWTETTYPVETCTPCDAAKNEYEVGEDAESGKKTYTCKTCEGKLELEEYPSDTTGNKHIGCTACHGAWDFTELSPNVKVCTACNTWTTITYREYLKDNKCTACGGKSVSEDLLTCNACNGTSYWLVKDCCSIYDTFMG